MRHTPLCTSARAYIYFDELAEPTYPGRVAFIHGRLPDDTCIMHGSFFGALHEVSRVRCSNRGIDIVRDAG